MEGRQVHCGGWVAGASAGEVCGGRMQLARGWRIVGLALGCRAAAVLQCDTSSVYCVLCCGGRAGVLPWRAVSVGGRTRGSPMHVDGL